MDGNKTGMPLFFMLFLFVKLVLGNLSDEQPTHTQESTVWKHGKVKTGQKEVGKCYVVVCFEIVKGFLLL